MAHINSHVQRRRSKMLDHAHRYICACPWCSTMGRRWFLRYRRHVESGTYAHLNNFRCSRETDCQCPGCSSEVATCQRQHPISPV